MANTNLNPSSLYFIHPNENPGVSIISTTLVSQSNYHTWCREVTMALELKNKFQFVDGSIPKPDHSDSTYEAWSRCNTLVLSWINRSLSKEIALSMLWRKVALDVWNALRSRYYQGDDFRISSLLEDLYALKQGDRSISSYFTNLQSIWEELESFRPILACACSIPCSCNLIPTIQGYRNKEFVIKFLKGLSEQYSHVRSQIMMMKPFPDIDQAFSLVLQQEREIIGNSFPSLLANLDTSSRGRGKGRSRGGGRYPASSRGSGGRGRPLCTHCNRFGHTVDQCYTKHGFPFHMQHDNPSIHNITSDESDDRGNTVAPPNERSGQENAGAFFTLEQQQRLLALLNQSEVQNHNPTHLINHVSTFTPQDSTSGQAIFEEDWHC